MKKSILLFALPVMASACLPAAAASGTLTFSGTVLNTCTIMVGGAGVLDTGSNGTVLTSTSGLGTPATATVLTTGSNFHVGVANPSNFTLAPTGAGAGVVFDTRYTTTGVTVVSNIASGVSTPLAIGLTALNVNLTATKPTIFPSGVYTAQTTVTCE